MNPAKSARLESGLFCLILPVLILQTGKNLFWFYVIASLLACITIWRLWHLRTFCHSRIHIAIWMAIFLLAINGLFSVSPVLSQITAWKLSLCLWCCLLLARTCNDQCQNSLCLAITATTLMASLWAIIQYLNDFYRTHGPQLDFNAFSAMLYCGSILCFMRYAKSSGHLRVVYCLAQFVMLFALMTTFSRGGITAWISGLVIIWAIHLRLRQLFQPLVTYIFLAILAWLAVKGLPWCFGEQGVSRHFNDLGSLSARIPQWQAAWQHFLENPWTGSGLGTFVLLYPSIRKEWISAGNFAHNDYLQLLMEGGIFVFLLFVAWLLLHAYLLIRLFLQRPKETDRKNLNAYYELGILLAANLMLFAHALINFIFYIEYLNVLAGLIFARILYLSHHLAPGKTWATSPISFPTRLSVTILLLALWGKMSLSVVPHVYFFEGKKTETVSIDPKELSLLLTIDPANITGTTIMVRTTLKNLPLLPDSKKQEAFNSTWNQAMIVASRIPAEPLFHYWLGRLADQAAELGLYRHPSIKSSLFYHKQAIALHPGFFPAQIEIAKNIEKQQGSKAALDYLKPLFERWHRMVPAKENLHLLNTMIRLSGNLGNKANYENFQKIRDNLQQWLNRPKGLYPRYEG